MKDNLPEKKVLIKKQPDNAQPPSTCVVLGETYVGKSYQNLNEIKIYIKDNPATGKKGRKVLIFDVNNEYQKIKTLPPTAQAIEKFNKQQTIEARRIVGRDEKMKPLTPSRQKEIAALIALNFINGMIVLDDLDKYAAHNNAQDLIGVLMGNRHIGCHIMISHQAWRKITPTEVENWTYIRLHHPLDTPESLPAEKKSVIPMQVCHIAQCIVSEQYELSNNLLASGKFKSDKDPRYLAAHSFFVYINVRKKKIFRCSPDAFMRGCYKYMHLHPKAVKAELSEMIYFGKITRVDAKKETAYRLAQKSLYEKLKQHYSPIPV